MMFVHGFVERFRSAHERGDSVVPKSYVGTMIDMAQSKRKISVTVDADLVEALGDAEENLSAQVNEAIRTVVEQRRRQAELRAWLDEMAAEHGPVDEELVRRFVDALA
jgi:post-segregation antitoxin (ccd killing protein)